MSSTSSRRLAVAVAAALALAVASCSSGSSGPTAASTTTKPSSKATAPIVFNGQGNNLDAYSPTPAKDGTFPTQRVYETVDTDPVHGRNINAQICFFPGDDGQQWFIAGEDTDQDEDGGSAGWGIFRMDGDTVGHLEATQLGKLIPTFQPTDDGAENYGCGRLSDGRLLTTDVGNQAGGEPNGQLIVWFPPFIGGQPKAHAPDFADVRYCKIDIGLGTAQSMLVRDDVIYVATARGDVYRFNGPFPTAPTGAGGCGKTDSTGAPMADHVDKSVFIKAGPHGLATPAGLANAPDNGFYVSSVFTGTINEYAEDGTFRRTILQPPAGAELGAKPYSTGTPLGLGVGPDGTLYFADIGVVVADGNAGPGDHTGSLRRIRFVDGTPQPPETMATGLDYPDGIGIWTPTS